METRQPPLDAIENALDEADYELAVRLASAAAQQHPADVDLQLLYGEALYELGDLGGAREAFRAALRLRPSPETAAWLARCHFLLLDFAEAARIAVHANDMAECAEAHDVLCRLAERDGDLPRADRHARRATALDPDGFPLPFRVPEGDFTELVEAALDEIPAPFRTALDGDVVVRVEAVPSLELLRGEQPPLAPDLLGLYVGTPLVERGGLSGSGQLADQVFLFQRNLEHEAGTRDELIEQVRVTVAHELGHYFGFSDEELEERDLG